MTSQPIAPEVLDQARTVAEDAIAVLTGSCDGCRRRDDAGFSMADQWFKRAPVWSADPAELAHILKALQKYTKTQIPEHADAIRDLLAVLAAKVIRVAADGTMYELAWPYDKALGAAIKAAIPAGSARWNPDQKCWRMTLAAARIAVATAEAAGYTRAGVDLTAPVTVASPAPAPARMADVRLALDGTSVRVNPQTRLGDRWSGYKAACDAAGFKSRQIAGEWRQVGKPEGAPALIAALEALGLTLEVDPAVLTARTAPVLAPAAVALDADGRPAWVPAETWAKLYRFQQAGIRWICTMDAGLLGDEMGLGKTIQALLAIPAAAPAVVIVPATLKLNWAAECRKWRPDLRPVVLSGRNAFRWPAAGEVIIINFDILPEAFVRGQAAGTRAADHKGPKVVLPLDGAAPQTMVIVDEVHLCKNTKAQRTLNLRAILAGAKAAGGRRLVMSGTPLVNRPPELWAVLQNAGLAAAAFDSWKGFLKAFGAYQGEYGLVWGGPSAQVPELLRRVMLRRERVDQLDLPGKSRVDVAVNGLTADVIAACDAAMAALDELELDPVKLERALAGDKIPAFDKLSRVGAMLATAKIPALLEAVESYEEAEEPLVVFSSHVAPIEALGKRPGWKVIMGGISAEARQAAVEEFQAGKLKGLACTTRAAGVGLTLTRARHEIFVDLDWTPAANSQAEDRCYRIGQTRSVLIKRLVASHPIDTRIQQLLDRKAALVAGSVEAATVRLA